MRAKVFERQEGGYPLGFAATESEALQLMWECGVDTKKARIKHTKEWTSQGAAMVTLGWVPDIAAETNQ